MSQQEMEQLFTGMLKDSGMPVTEAQMRAEWNKVVDGQDCKISNNSAWSPFWRLITAIVTAPCQWLLRLLVRYALPNMFVRYATGKWLDLLAWAVALTRKAAEFAFGELTFSRAGAGTQGDINIPAGTVVESPKLAGKVYRVFTLEDALIEDGQKSARVKVRAEEPGSAYNLGPGYYSILPKSLPGVESAANEANWLTTPGADEELDELLRLRIRNQFAAVGQYHHDAAYRVIIHEFSGIRLDYLFFEKDGPRGPGTANCHIMIESGIPPQDLVDGINAHVMESGEHGHGDDLLCMPITALPVDLEAAVYPADELSGTEPEAVAAREALRLETENMIRSAFRENQNYNVTRVLPMSQFSFSLLDRELHNALASLKSIEFNRADIVAGLALPVLSSFAVHLAESKTPETAEVTP